VVIFTEAKVDCFSEIGIASQRSEKASDDRFRAGRAGDKARLLPPDLPTEQPDGGRAAAVAAVMP